MGMVCSIAIKMCANKTQASDQLFHGLTHTNRIRRDFAGSLARMSIEISSDTQRLAFQLRMVDTQFSHLRETGVVPFLINQ